jgi:hypothetical protein
MTQFVSDIVIGTYKQRYEIIQAIQKELDKYMKDYDNLSDDLEIEFEVRLTIKE